MKQIPLLRAFITAALLAFAITVPVIGADDQFVIWEATQYKFMHQASLEWLNSTTYRGSSSGTFIVGRSDSSVSIKP